MIKETCSWLPPSICGWDGDDVCLQEDGREKHDSVAAAAAVAVVVELFCCYMNLNRTRKLAINVSIPNLTVARLEQFPSPQMTDNKTFFT